MSRIRRWFEKREVQVVLRYLRKKVFKKVIRARVDSARGLILAEYQRCREEGATEVYACMSAVHRFADHLSGTH